MFSSLFGTSQLDTGHLDTGDLATMDRLLTCGENFSWHPDIEQELWRKLVINCVINPLTAIHGCRNGDLIENPRWQREARTVCNELARVTAALGYRDLAAHCWREAEAVMRATAGNQSSMMRDLAAGRATEIHQITGYLLMRARELGIECPENQRLFDQVTGHNPGTQSP